MLRVLQEMESLHERLGLVDTPLEDGRVRHLQRGQWHRPGVQVHGGRCGGPRRDIQARRLARTTGPAAARAGAGPGDVLDDAEGLADRGGGADEGAVIQDPGGEGEVGAFGLDA